MALVIRRDGTAEITSSVSTGSALADVAFAASGSALILEGGAEVEARHPITRELHPRTAIGLTQDRKTLVLMVVDGRQPGYSEGADFADLARLLRNEGCSDALNMDGGGSSSLVVFDHATGEPVMLNHHAGGAIRATAVNFGITFTSAAEFGEAFAEKPDH
jgi:exopolysaccharide biosynthesis protein